MLTVITGKIRIGKTSFMTAKAIERARNTAKRLEMRRAVSELKRKGFNVSTADYALYANYRIKFDDHRGATFESERIEPKRLFIGDNATFIRPFSVLAISEAQTYFNARHFQTFTAEQARFFQTSGHFGVDILLDTQDIDTLDKTLRGLCEIYEIKSRTIYDNRGRVTERAEPRDVSRIVFKYSYRNDVNARAQHGTYIIDYNVFECYNSYECYNDYLPADKKGIII